MLLAHQNKPSLWGSLLWKDFQQVKLAFLVLAGGALCMQLLFLIIVWLTLDLEQWGPLVNSVFGLASATPILLALGCSGMLIGHERQSGNWAWSSSLPVSWWQALSSKLIVTTLGSLVVSLPLGVIPALLSTSQKLQAPYGGTDVAYYSLTLLIFLEVIVVCFLATVLMRETLGALLVAGLVSTVLPIFLSLPWWHNNSLATWITHRLGVASDLVPAFWFLFLSASILALGFILLLVAFRWRWTFGQQTKLAFWQERASTIVSGHFRYRESSGARPNEWWMMFVHSLRNNFVMGLLVLANFVICTVIFLRMDDVLHIFFVLLAMLALGVTTFQSDQMLGRFRFLADRGIAPWKLVLSRLAVSLGMAAPTFIVYFLVLAFNRGQFGFFAGTIAFSLGALASICFRKQVIAIGAAVLVGVFGLFVNVPLYSWVLREEQSLTQFYDSAFEIILLRYLPIGALVLVASLFWLARRWLVLDKPNLEIHFLWVSSVALLTPFCFACTFGFLAIPDVPEIAIPVESSTSRELKVQNYLTIAEPLLVGDLPGLAILSRYQSGTMHMIASSAHAAVGTVQNELNEKVDKPISERINSVLRELDGLQNQAKVPMSYGLQIKLDVLILRTAALASIALKEKEAELGLRLWKLNRELQDVSSEVDAMHAGARKSAMYLLLDLNSDDVQLLGGADIYRSLIPNVADEKSSGIKYSLVDERNNLQRLKMHWLSVTRYFPPLRWLFERKIVSDHRSQRAQLFTLPKNYITGDVRRQLEQRFPE